VRTAFFLDAARFFGAALFAFRGVVFFFRFFAMDCSFRLMMRL
jgi:hypothetical protein